MIKWAVAVVAATGVVIVVPSAARAADSVFWTNSYDATIAFAWLDGSGADRLGSTGAGPQGVAIDAAAGRIYWAIAGINAIVSARLGGTDPRVLNTAGVDVYSPHGIAIDAAAGRIYWANEGNNTISYARLDGSGGGQLNTTGATVSYPQGVTIDAAAGRIYWANVAANTISYARLDGSGGGNLNVGSAPVNGPEGVAIDAASGLIYWANWLGNSIAFARLDGSGGGQLSITGATASGPWGIAVDATTGRVYWANQGNGLGGGKISYARSDGSGGGDLDPTSNLASGPSFLALIRAPAAAGPPAVSGATIPGSSLSCSTGAWATDSSGAFLSRAPQSYGYQWSVNGSDIPGATTTTIPATSAGDYRCRVTAANHAGQTAQTSDPHTIVLPPPLPPPAVTVLPQHVSATPAAKPRPRLVVFPTTRRDPRGVRVVARGELVAPEGVLDGRACAGRMSLTVKRGAKIVALGTATVRRDCSFAIRATVSRSRIKARRRLAYTVRFLGNDALAPATKSGVLRLAR